MEDNRENIFSRSISYFSTLPTYVHAIVFVLDLAAWATAIYCVVMKIIS